MDPRATARADNDADDGREALVWPPPEEELDGLQVLPFVPDERPSLAAASHAAAGVPSDDAVAPAAQAAGTVPLPGLRRWWAALGPFRQPTVGRRLYVLLIAGVAIAAAVGYLAAAWWRPSASSGTTAVVVDASRSSAEPRPSAEPRLVEKPPPGTAVTVPLGTTGSLEIVSDPAGALVVVEGRSRGTTPVTLAGLDEGIHDVLLSHKGRRRVRRVVVRANRTANLSVSFVAPVVAQTAPGTLAVRAPIELGVPAGSGLVSINATPWATVSVGDRQLGDTPLANISLPAGRHEFVFRHPELGERRRVAIITPGGTSRVSVDLRQ